MKLLLTLLLLFFLHVGFSQDEKSSIYFPQEQLIHPECKNSDNANSCLKNKANSILNKIIQKAAKENKIKVDTLKVRISFEVDKKGYLTEGRDFTFVNDSTLRTDFKKDLRNITKRLPRFKVLNRKAKTYLSKHFLLYSYEINKSNDSTEAVPIEDDNLMYNGGVIEEVPLFPGCKRKDDQKTRNCFQKMMQKHIAKNFVYPEVAQARGLQGKVSIMFIIDKGGNVTDLKVRGPNSILEDEAIRIIKLLPKMGSGLQNGKAVRVPYSIPITFRLN